MILQHQGSLFFFSLSGFFFSSSSSPFPLPLPLVHLQSSSPRTESPMEILNDAFLSDLEKFRSISKIQH
ncbi:hypothetical protein GmHk_20G058461 [Glycine max]|nr:hypothetical protein GmHk_20G058461 [Glycine max]